MKSEYDSLFHDLIVAPLQRVARHPLRAVNYYIIWGKFDPESPNEYGGCQGVHLVFDGGEVEFDWAFEREFRGGNNGITYHLSVSDHSIRRNAVRKWTEDDSSGLNLIPAAHTQLWKRLIGQPVVRLDVLGERIEETRCSPQAVRLHFPSTRVIIAIGMTREGDQPTWAVGDGDEVLVFSEQEWEILSDQGVGGVNRLTCCWDWPH